MTEWLSLCFQSIGQSAFSFTLFLSLFHALEHRRRRRETQEIKLGHRKFPFRKAWRMRWRWAFFSSHLLVLVVVGGGSFKSRWNYNNEKFLRERISYIHKYFSPILHKSLLEVGRHERSRRKESERERMKISEKRKNLNYYLDFQLSCYFIIKTLLPSFSLSLSLTWQTHTHSLALEWTYLP